MDEFGVRLGLLARILVPFLFMMASVYLLTHIVFARLISSPRSQVRWFFDVVTNPLTRPVRAVLPPGTSDSRVRVVALAVYIVLWVVTDKLAKLLGASAH